MGVVFESAWFYPRNRVRAKVALAWDERQEGLGERVVPAAGAEEARGVVCGALLCRTVKAQVSKGARGGF